MHPHPVLLPMLFFAALFTSACSSSAQQEADNRQHLDLVTIDTLYVPLYDVVASRLSSISIYIENMKKYAVGIDHIQKKLYVIPFDTTLSPVIYNLGDYYSTPTAYIYGYKIISLDSIILGAHFSYFQNYIADESLCLFIPSRNVFQPLIKRSDFMRTRQSAEIGPGSLLVAYSEINVSNGKIIVGTSPFDIGLWIRRRGTYPVFGYLDMADSQPEFVAGAVMYPFIDSICWQPYSSDRSMVSIVNDSTLVSFFYNRDKVLVYNFQSNQLVRTFQAGSLIRASTPRLDNCAPVLNNRPYSARDRNPYSFWDYDSTRNLHVYTFYHSSIPNGRIGADNLSSGTNVCGILALDSAYNIVGEGLLPPGWAEGRLHPPSLHHDGWYFLHRGESLRRQNELVFTRVQPRMQPMPTAALRKMLADQREQQAGRTANFDTLARRALATPDTLPTPMLLLDPGKLCPSCIEDMFESIAGTGALRIPLAISYHPEFHSPEMNKMIREIVRKQGAFADSTGLLSDNFIPEHGSAWLYYYSRQKRRWLRTEVSIHEIMPALRGQFVPAMER